MTPIPQGRPCGHTKAAPGANCTICDVASRDPRYAAVMDGETLSARSSNPLPVTACAHLRQPTGNMFPCTPCGGGISVKGFACTVYGECTLVTRVKGVACCARGTCPRYVPQPENTSVESGLIKGDVQWSYGVTTVPARRGNLLPVTLASLNRAGFPSPHLFVDGDSDGRSWVSEFGLSVTCRSPKIRTAGHWILSMWEIYLRNPSAHRFALFQDDVSFTQNIRPYLERCPYPTDGYLNLYSFPSNENLVPKEGGRPRNGWYPSNQYGRGAIALVFSRDAVMALLAAKHLVDRCQDPHRGFKAIDGGIVDSMRKAGWREYVHHPCLTQHTGKVSSMGNQPHLESRTFPGETFDCLSLLERQVNS